MLDFGSVPNFYWIYPLPSSSDHQDYYMFSRGLLYIETFICHYYWGGGHTQYIYIWISLVGGFKYFVFLPLPREMIQFDEHIFQMGWFNHQLDTHRFNIFPYFHGNLRYPPQSYLPQEIRPY